MEAVEFQCRSGGPWDPDPSLLFLLPVTEAASQAGLVTWSLGYHGWVLFLGAKNVMCVSSIDTPGVPDSV